MSKKVDNGSEELQSSLDVFVRNSDGSYTVRREGTLQEPVGDAGYVLWSEKRRQGVFPGNPEFLGSEVRSMGYRSRDKVPFQINMEGELIEGAGEFITLGTGGPVVWALRENEESYNLDAMLGKKAAENGLSPGDTVTYTITIPAKH